LASEVLDEVIETVYVLENLTFLADKAGLFTFDLRSVLEAYLGDVQIVTEFATYRNDIIGNFHSALENIITLHPKARIHIVAHSEGTVVSFLALLLAMSGKQVIPKRGSDLARVLDADVNDAGSPLRWLRNIRGFMTIGSPIDKHLLLWRRLWTDLDPQKANPLFTGERIRWRNYYDFGDPIGFKLETARDWLELKQCEAFDFCGCKDCLHDIGFARYFLPGKAHNDYWDDPAVFEHFIRQAVMPIKEGEDPARLPKLPELNDRWWVKVLSPLLPYALSGLLLFVGAWMLYRAVADYANAELEPFQQYVRYTLLGLPVAQAPSGSELILSAIGLTLLVSGVTLFARLPRLAFGLVWWIYGALGFLLGAASYWIIVPASSRATIGSVVASDATRSVPEMARRLLDPVVDPAALAKEAVYPTLVVLGIALVVAGVGLASAFKQRKQQKELVRFDPTATPRRQRWFRRGMRPLILGGAAGMLIIGTLCIYTADSQRKRLAEVTVEVQRQQRAAANQPPLTEAKEKKIRSLAATLGAKPSLWPVVISGAAFLYLWWLAALIFDLAFVWQRYVRQATGIERLREWWLFQLPDGRKPASVSERVRNLSGPLARLTRWWGHRPASPVEPHRDRLSQASNTAPMEPG
jgi:hypothetical protein